jgi:hypothetical protein
MSWKQFEKEVGDRMEANGFSDATEFAKFFTTKYDECIKRGFDLVTFNTVLNANTDFMEAMINIANTTAIAAQTSSLYDLYFNMLGDAVTAYWMGAKLTIFFTPIIPAPGTTMNIGVTDNSVTNVGVWPKTKVPPMKNVRIFLKTFVSFAKIHLFTIQGLCSTISLYPPLGTPSPALIQWQGFKVIEPSKKYIKENANIYDAPIDGLSIKSTINKGEEVVVTKIDAIWVYIKDTNNIGGFIKKDFITDTQP